MTGPIAWKRWLLASIVHFGLTVLALGVVHISAGNFDDPQFGKPSSPAIRVVEGIVAVLMSPGTQLWALLQPRGTHLPDALEHLVFAGNSGVWGGVLSAIMGLARKRRDSNA